MKPTFEETNINFGTALMQAFNINKVKEKYIQLLSYEVFQDPDVPIYGKVQIKSPPILTLNLEMKNLRRFTTTEVRIRVDLNSFVDQKYRHDLAPEAFHKIDEELKIKSNDFSYDERVTIRLGYLLLAAYELVTKGYDMRNPTKYYDAIPFDLKILDRHYDF